MIQVKYDRVEKREIMHLQEALAHREGRSVPLEEAVNCWEDQYACRWREQRLARQMARQREEILRHKWIESEKAQRDLGAEAVLDWIRRYAAQWRHWYEEYEVNEAPKVSLETSSGVSTR